MEGRGVGMDGGGMGEEDGVVSHMVPMDIGVWFIFPSPLQGPSWMWLRWRSWKKMKLCSRAP